VESTDHRIELIQMSQVQPTHQGMVIIEAPFQRPLQIGDLRAHKVRLIVLRPSGPSPGTHHRHRDDVLAHINKGAPLVQNMHPTSPFPAQRRNQQRALRREPPNMN
ncbi:hypothetical protein, partial [Mycobacterium canetti]